MNTAQAHEQKPRFIDLLSNFLSRHRTTLVVVLIVIAVAVVALFVALEIRSARIDRSMLAVDELQDQYAEWVALTEDERTAELDGLLEQARGLDESYSRLYAAQRALFVQGRALSLVGRHDEASEKFVEIADRFPESYLAPISLTLAAVALENDGNPEAALPLLERIVETYDETSAEVPRALFSMGRINESLDNIVEALVSYNRLIDDFPGSSWTNLARNRIITLSVEGRIGS
jgi:tetratricopeptide (TPR) repeat protein